LATELVLVVPEAGVDRVRWAKQLVGNAVRSPHTRQAYHYALEQFFHWAAGRAVSRESVQGLRHLARGNEVLALDHQSTPGGDPQTCDRSATWTARRRRRLLWLPA
jgi:hypothetical protein